MDSCNCTGASALLVRLCGKAQRLRIVRGLHANDFEIASSRLAMQKTGQRRLRLSFRGWTGLSSVAPSTFSEEQFFFHSCLYRLQPASSVLPGEFKGDQTCLNIHFSNRDPDIAVVSRSQSLCPRLSMSSRSACSCWYR